ncbi:MAG TPA: hypothetical protein VGS58_22520 [Candidatus Sulfopaludibacter sp.]|nr:hypothetical protein [Candidatus Sulfopaludibacter sp.]
MTPEPTCDLLSATLITAEAREAWQELCRSEMLRAVVEQAAHPTSIDDERAEMLPDGSLRIYADIHFAAGAVRVEMVLPPQSWAFTGPQQ